MRVCVCVCEGAADAEVLSYYQQGITVVKATLLFDCLPPDARPPGVALHFRTYATVFCGGVLLHICSSSFSLHVFTNNNARQFESRGVSLHVGKKILQIKLLRAISVDITMRDDTEVR